MEIIIDINELRHILSSAARPIGFVPTMGFLHEGHISLVRRARQECANVVVSIFINPTQFSSGEDLNRYPRDLPRDLTMLEKAGVDFTWTPSIEEMFPEGFNSWVNVEGLSKGLEGEKRPGHFRGVTTVVTKLFHAVNPQKAYFGQKDAQQLAVIRKMTQDLNFPIEIISCPTVREKDGLAMSSRNIFLSGEERQAANVLYRALMSARLSFQNGERDAGKLRDQMTSVLRSEPLVVPQYISCADVDTLEEVKYVQKKALLSMAVFIGKTRLIDNLVLGE